MFCTFQSTVVQKNPKFGWDLLREDTGHLAVAGDLVGHLLAARQEFRLSDFGFGCGLWDVRFRVSGFRFGVSGFGFRVSASGFGVPGFGFKEDLF